MSFLGKDFVIDGYELKNFINLSHEESSEILRWRNHDNVRKWMYNDHKITASEHGAFIKNLAHDEKNHLYKVTNTQTGIALGVLSLNRLNARHRHAYFAIYANPLPPPAPCRGRGTDS